MPDDDEDPVSQKEALEKKTHDFGFWFGVFGVIFGAAGVIIGGIALKPIIFPSPPDCDATVAAYSKLLGEHAALISGQSQFAKNIKTAERTLNAIIKQKKLIVGFMNEEAVAKEMRSLAISLMEARDHHIEAWGENAFDIHNGNRKAFFEDMYFRGWPKDPRERRDMRLHFSDVSSFNSDSFYYQFDSTPSSPEVIEVVVNELVRASNELGPYGSQAWKLGWSEERIAGGKGLRVIADLDGKITEGREMVFNLKTADSTRASSAQAANFQLASLKASFTDRGCAGELQSR